MRYGRVFFFVVTFVFSRALLRADTPSVEADIAPEGISVTVLEVSEKIKQKDYDGARKLLNQLADTAPKLTLVHYFLGRLYTEMVEIDSAISSYQRALKEDSHFVEVRPLLAPLLESKKEIDEAWKQYARVLAADSRNKSAKLGMSRLAHLITKKPEEILPPKKIPTHSAVAKVEGRENLPKIRVGIGTTSGGDPSRKESLAFRTAKPFVIIDPETKRELKSGEALSTWIIRFDVKKGFAEILSSTGNVIGRFQRTIVIRQKDEGPTTTIINSLAYAPDTTWGGLADKELRGDLEVRVNWGRRTLVVVNHVTLEEYLYGVLAAEMPIQWPLEALKAQAVIARTQGLYRKGLHKKYGYDICDEQHCQVYTGVAVESKKVYQAVDETRGQYLVFEGRPAHTVFSSNCGGVSQTGGQAGWGNVAYWQSIYDGEDSSVKPTSLPELWRWIQDYPRVYCESSKYTWNPEFRWTRVVMADDIASKISRKTNVGKIKKIQIVERNASGRVKKLKIVGTKATKTLSKEHEIRKYMGLGSQRSTLFVMDTLYNGDMPESFVLYGGGWGHGVGFCQSGAAGRAEQGQDWKQILEAYFPGTRLALR